MTGENTLRRTAFSHSPRPRAVLFNFIIYLLLALSAVVMLVPFLWVLSSSFKDTASIFLIPPQWIPKQWHFENYWNVLTGSNLIRGFCNTVIIIIPPIFVGMLSSSLAGYSFARLQFPGKNVIFAATLCTMMVPGVITLIPSFIMFSFYGWVNSWKPLIIPGMFGAVTTMFFLRQYFMTLPKELEEAAMIDGMSRPKIFVSIILPLSKPAIVTQIVLSLNGAYNDYMGPLLYINDINKQTLQQVLAGFQGTYLTQWGYLMAGSVLALLPTMLIFALAQRYFVEGIALTGLKV